MSRPLTENGPALHVRLSMPSGNSLCRACKDRFLPVSEDSVAQFFFLVVSSAQSMKYKRLVPLFALVIFSTAAYLLYRALSAYEPAKILEAILAIPLARLALGALFVAGSYVSLTLFDMLAIRYIGAKLSYPRIALASFTALSIGHTLGLAAASSGAIRYRFYFRWDIGAGDIARIILFCAMTTTLGLNTLMGLALVLQANVAAKLLGFSQPGAIALGAACLALNVLYVALAAVLRRPLAIKRWEIPIPPVKLAIAQISIGTNKLLFRGGSVVRAAARGRRRRILRRRHSLRNRQRCKHHQPRSWWPRGTRGRGYSRPAGCVHDRRSRRFSFYLLSTSIHNRGGSVRSL